VTTPVAVSYTGFLSNRILYCVMDYLGDSILTVLLVYILTFIAILFTVIIKKTEDINDHAKFHDLNHIVIPFS
jgi:DNA integrity scanning protein DisA with diadenylate cyclase activity